MARSVNGVCLCKKPMVANGNLDDREMGVVTNRTPHRTPGRCHPIPDSALRNATLKGGPTWLLVEIHPGGPGGGEALAGAAAYINGEAGFFRQGVGGADSFDGTDVGEGLVEPGFGKADRDNHFT